MTVHDWIAWAFCPADTRHRFASFILARQASRDLRAEITVAEFEAAMQRAGFAVDHRNQRGAASYLVAETKAKKTYELHRFILVEPIDHPLNKPSAPDHRAAFKALPPDNQAAVLQWIETSLVPIRRTRTVSQLRYPCHVVAGLTLSDEQMRRAVDGPGHDGRSPLPLLPKRPSPA